MQELLTTAEVAKVLETSERMVHHLVATERLKPVRKIGRANLFDPTAVALLKPNLVRRNWNTVGGAA